MKAVTLSADTSVDGLYRIANVSSLTGIPVQTIRGWESRHAVVQPMRSTGNVRLYRRAHIERLLLIKAAVDAGHSIGTVASLTDRQLKARFKDAPGQVAKVREGCCRVLVCGTALVSMLKTAWGSRPDVRVQRSLRTLADAEGASLPSVDALVVDAPVLNSALPPALRQLRAATKAPVVIVVYGFGNRQILSRLDDANVIALAAPIDPAQIARICRLGLGIDPTPPAAFLQALMYPAGLRRYDDAFLAQLSQMPSKLQCECPNHLADLLAKLSAFERYSLECERANPADASIHAMLHNASGHCRELLEQALQRVLVHDGIPEPQA